jgi:hypothetical protein
LGSQKGIVSILFLNSILKMNPEKFYQTAMYCVERELPYETFADHVVKWHIEELEGVAYSNLDEVIDVLSSVKYKFIEEYTPKWYNGLLIEKKESIIAKKMEELNKLKNGGIGPSKV